jgi:GTP-binding protein
MSAALRNIAIIAHVDHGKTTLVDQLFRQSGTFRDNQRIEERAMDSNDLEKERGITILAKPTSVEWNGIRINIVDTPGHADFGGEVERILSMVDGVILLVDSSEGAMPQTKFVTGKALALGLKPIVVVNKVDRPDERIQEVLDEVFDLFVALEASDEQLDFPVLYASGRNGYASEDPQRREGTLEPMFQKIVDHVPPPSLDQDAPFSFLVTLLDRDNFLGRVLTGRVQSGTLKVNQPIHALDMDGKVIETGRASKIMSYRGLERVPVDEAKAGDIISLAGLAVATVSNTICDTAVSVPIQAQPIDPPTLSMRFAVNDSPMAGREGDKVTSRMIRDRLFREAESNVAIKVTESADKDSFEVAGRGELQLGVLIETLRREGFELSISRPRVIFREEAGVTLEPVEEATIDVDDDFAGVVIEKLTGPRRG